MFGVWCLAVVVWYVCVVCMYVCMVCMCGMYVWYVWYGMVWYGMYVLYVCIVYITCMYGMYGVKKCKLLHVADPPGGIFGKNDNLQNQECHFLKMACCPILIPDSEFT